MAEQQPHRYTIKHVDDGGHEVVESAASVTFDQKTNTLTGHRLDAKGNPDPVSWNYGHAFVMNEHGKTVSVYSMRQGHQRSSNHHHNRRSST